MKIKGAIFDLDGTLLDSMWYWDKLGEEYLASFGKTPRPDFRDKYYVYSTDETAKMIVDDYGLSETPQGVIDGMWKLAGEFYRKSVKTKPHVMELLDKMKAAGIKMAVATATERSLVDIAVERCGLADYFEAIVTCTDVGASKTRPDVYLKALEYLDADVAETAVFEDALAAAQSAKSAGFYTVGVHDVTAVVHESEMRALCDEYLTDFSDLSDII